MKNKYDFLTSNRPTQQQMYAQTCRDITERHLIVMNMFHGPNPLTNSDLERLVARFPQRWEQYKGYIGKLKD